MKNNCSKISELVTSLASIKGELDSGVLELIGNSQEDKEIIDRLYQTKERLESGLKELDEIWPKTKVGLSLSFCIRDIYEGRVKEREIKEIQTSTTAKSPEAWKKILETYRENYWYRDPKTQEAIFWRLLNSGRIKQPRLEGKGIHNIADGHWLDTGDTPDIEEEMERRRKLQRGF